MGDPGDTEVPEEILDLAVSRGHITRERLEEERARFGREGSGSFGAWLVARGLLDSGQLRPDVPVQRIGRYAILREIARGGMGVVYEAEDPQLRRRVALKVLRSDEVSPTLLQRLHREATIAARFQHPNIVRVHEIGESGPYHFLSMDLVEGETLAAILRARRASRDVLLGMLEDVARAVQYAHEMGVFHRDLKPANVIVDREGRVRLVDFGLAHAEGFLSKLTRSQAVMGTPQYMAPEQAEGRAAEVDARTDVYALGVMLFEMVEGRPPFVAETPARLYDLIVRSEATAIHADRDLQIVCATAMAKEPARRYPTALAFAEDLARFRRREPVSARAPSLWYVVRRKLVRHRTGALLAVAVLAVLAASGVVGSVLWKRHHEFRDSKERALAAYDRGEWERARTEADRALRISDDPRLQEIASECRERIAAEREEAERRLRRSELRVKLEAELLRPLAAQIAETKPYFYVPKLDLRPRLDAVERRLADLEARTEDLPELWSAVGQGWLFLGDLRKAERALRRALDLAPDLAEGHAALGRVCFARMLEILLGMEPGPEAARWGDEALDHFRRAGEAGTELEKRCVDVWSAMAANDWPEAARRCQAALAASGDAPGTEELMVAAGWMSAPADAVAWYTKALERCPHHAWAFVMRSRAHFELGERDRALPDATAALALNPRFPFAWLLRGRIHRSQGKLDLAIADFEEAARADPGWEVPHNDLGVALQTRGDLDRAIEAYTAAIRLNGRYGHAYHNRAVARSAKRDAEGALRDADDAVRLAPDDATVYLTRARIRSAAKRWREAESDCTEAIRLRPAWAAAHHERGLVRRALEEYAKAVEDYTEAIRLSPGPGVHLDRGVARALLGDGAGAESDFREALRLSPPDWPHRATAERNLEILRQRRENP